MSSAHRHVGAPAAPLFSLAPGPYSATQVVTVTAAAGAVIRYTTSGVDPVNTDAEIPASGAAADESNASE